MKYKLKIIDQEIAYANKLSSYIQSRHGDLFSLFYGDIENQEDVLCVQLKEDEAEEEGIFKYQPGEQIVQELLWNMTRETSQKPNTKPVKFSVLLAHQNFLGASRKKVFQMMKEQERDGRILYLNFARRGFVTRDQCLTQGRDMLDLIYSAHYHKELFWTRFSGCIIEKEGITCMVPPTHLWNCMKIEEAIYKHFFQLLENQDTYRRIVVDMDEMFPFYTYILTRMDDCYCLYEEDDQRVERQKQLQEILALIGAPEQLNQCYFIQER